ncbi:MAG: hypothetical protein F6J89_02035 [Symploca sp. SIO1C4]|uniref:Peptidase C14 n=1 Tax=Symploca sp. SIO1C4 TaxID=2607765 RepID=A0A6B3N4G7_9CYAN|nr:hypothetical protein [Symploca sp. SIO1C4]
MSRDALVVGINTYKYEGLSNLQAPASDAEAIAQLLEKHGDFKVWRLPEAINQESGSSYIGGKIKVTLAQLEDSLIKLFNPQAKSVPDTALFYFSGHGLRRTLGIQEGFLATSDSYPEARFYGLSLQGLRRLLQESPIKQQIVWLDCCHSGELLNMNEADPGDQGQARDRCFITASREFEKAYEDISEPYSVLTKVLLEGLDPSRYPERWVTNYSLVDFLNQHLKGVPQCPTFHNFGEPINLTRTWEIKPAESTSENNSAICPYKGLEYFDCNEEDPKYFFGREKLTDRLIVKMRQCNFLAILGASGSGKSSVLRAGLLHQLKLGQKLGGSQQWQFYLMLPGEHPLQNLAKVFLEPDLTQVERAEQLKKAQELLTEGANGLCHLVQASDAPRVVLIIDQFEEVFSLCKNEVDRQKFIECLLGASEQVKDQLSLIISMRADFFSKCLESEYSSLTDKIKDNLMVEPMTQEELRRAITLPAQRVNLGIEPELVEQMVQDVKGSPGSLPLLQDTLTELWKNINDNTLELGTYAQLGGISGTLNQRANKVYEDFDTRRQEATKHIFLYLTQLGEGTEDTRRRVLKQDLVTPKYQETLIDEVVQKLADEKLVVTSFLGEKGLEAERVAVVDVAHEALIRHWGKLREWLDENRVLLQKQKRIADYARIWQENQYQSDLLLRGNLLLEAEDIFIKYTDELPEQVQKFVIASVEERVQQQQRAKVTIGAMAVLAAFVLGLGLYSYVQALGLHFEEQYNKLITGGSAEPEQLKVLSKALQKAKWEAKKGADTTAIKTYKEILRAAQNIEESIQEIPNKFSDNAQKKIEDIQEDTEISLAKLVKEHYIPALEKELNKPKPDFGILKPGAKLSDFENQFTGALKTTYEVLMGSPGLAADSIYKNGSLDSNEVIFLPCQTLKTIDYLWRQATNGNCGFHGEDSWLAPNCQELKGETLTFILFESEKPIRKHLQNCEITPSSHSTLPSNSNICS